MSRKILKKNLKQIRHASKKELKENGNSFKARVLEDPKQVSEDNETGKDRIIEELK